MLTAGDTVLASCTDTDGAATYGSNQIVSGSIPAECSNTGAGVAITVFDAQAVDASGNNIAASSGGNDYWVVAVVVIIVILLLILYMWWKRKKKGPMPAAQASSATPGVPTDSATRFCTSCGSPVESDATFCPNCGKPL
jgi:hypothetical protein